MTSDVSWVLRHAGTSLVTGQVGREDGPLEAMKTVQDPVSSVLTVATLTLSSWREAGIIGLLETSDIVMRVSGGRQLVWPGCGMRWLVFGQRDTSWNNLARRGANGGIVSTADRPVAKCIGHFLDQWWIREDLALCGWCHLWACGPGLHKKAS